MIKAATPAARAARWPVGLVALVLAYWAFDYSAASNVRRSNPEVAYRARPTDPGAIAAVMTDRMVVRNQFEASDEDAANARAGLREDPLNRVLLRTIGVHGELTGKQQDALRAMEMADRVSRRDSIAELWLAEYYRRKKAPARALVHYDAAMLVRPKLQFALLAQMVKMIPDPAFRAAVQPYIRRQSSWTVSFIGTAASENLDDIVGLVDPTLEALANGRNNPAIAKIVYRLAARGDTRKAISMAERGFPGVKGAQLGDVRWSKATTDRRLGALAWAFTQDEKVSSSLDEKGALTMTVSPLASAKAAVRDVLVRPNTAYTLAYRLAYLTPSSQARVQWQGECIDPVTALPTPASALPALAPASETEAVFRTGPGCHLLRLTAQVTGTDGTMPSELTLSNLRWRQGVVAAQP